MAALLGVYWYRAAVIVAGVCGAAVVAVVTLLELKAEVQEEQDAAVRRLAVPIVPVAQVDPYRIGIDRPAQVALQEAALDPNHVEWSYVPRDIDEQLRQAIRDSRTSAPDARHLIVVSGPSKSGKSRALFEAARAELHDALLVAPRRREDLVELLKPGVLSGMRGEGVVFWLDDLELHVGIGSDGLDVALLERIRAVGGRGLALATLGGKGTEALSSAGRQQLIVPARQILNSPLCREIVLVCELTAAEVERARAHYSLDMAPEIKRGIGEFMVAGPELVRKLRTACHPGELACPEGAAITWAAVDWRRSGMVRPVPRDCLRELFPLYLSGLEATDQRFDIGLEWAQRAIFGSVRLVSADAGGGFLPYDFIVSQADHDSNLKRDLPADTWERVFQLTSPPDAFFLGIAAVKRLPWTCARRAWEHAAQAESALVAGAAAFNLGTLLRAHDDTEGALAAYRRAEELGSWKSANNLGVLLQERGDLEEAVASYRRAAARGHANAAYNLGVLLQKRGDLEGALAAYHRADELGDGPGASNLGVLLHERGDLEGALAAYRRADEHGDVVGAYNLGALLQDRGDLEGALAAYRRADGGGYPSGAYNLGVLLQERDDLEGALAAYRRATERGSAAGAHNLGVLLQKCGDLEGALAAFRRGDELGDAAASHNLGVLLAEHGDTEGAVAALGRAACADDEAVAFMAKAAIRMLKH